MAEETKKGMPKGTKEKDVDLELSAFEDDGFIRLNPEPRYWNADGAGTLVCVVIDREFIPKDPDNAFYTVVAMRPCKNGPITDKKTGEVHYQPDIEPGDTIRVGARHQIDQTLPKVCGKKALVAIKPLRKVRTSGGNEVWQFAIMAKKLPPAEHKQFEHFHLGDFESLNV